MGRDAIVEWTMQPVTPDARRYDGRTMFFHWATLVLVIEQFAGAWTIDDFPRGALRVDARSFHITMGVMLAVLLLARVFWRATGGRRLPAADHGALHVVAKGTHWGLYLLLLAMVTVGCSWRGPGATTCGTCSRCRNSIRPITSCATRCREVHATIGWMIIGLAGLHASAAIVHRVLWHDGVLRRMAPHGSAGWCCWRGLNSRPLPYQGSALPLSYSSAG